MESQVFLFTVHKKDPATRHPEPDWLSPYPLTLSSEIHCISYTFLSRPEFPAVLLLFSVDLMYRDVTFHAQSHISCLWWKPFQKIPPKLQILLLFIQGQFLWLWRFISLAVSLEGKRRTDWMFMTTNLTYLLLSSITIGFLHLQSWKVLFTNPVS
jgi:hypothetical protein